MAMEMEIHTTKGSRSLAARVTTVGELRAYLQKLEVGEAPDGVPLQLGNKQISARWDVDVVALGSAPPPSLVKPLRPELP